MGRKAGAVYYALQYLSNVRYALFMANWYSMV